MGWFCEFVAGDKSHLLMEKIILMLLATDAHLKFSWHDDDDDYDIDCDKINEYINFYRRIDVYTAQLPIG